MPTIGKTFDARNNSLNFLRVVLALTVLVSHALALAGFGVPTTVNGTGFGEIALFGFFGISGFLIAGSALRSGAVRFLWQRILRIFPAFWVCLLVTAFVIGVVAWLSHPAVPHCGISCYFAARQNSPYEYVYRNLFLQINQNSIAGTPRGGPAPLIWNGSLWSLQYEFLCYLILMTLALFGLLRRRVVILIATVCLCAAVTVITLTPAFDDNFNFYHNDATFDVLKLTSTFMVGAIVFLYRERIADSGWIALTCTGLIVACLYWPLDGQSPLFTFTKSELLVPLIAYPLLWLGIHLPFQRVGARNDYSYGLYIYGFPVSQLLVIWGVEKWGVVPYTMMAVLCTVPLAVASWWAIEKHALRLKSLNLRTGTRPNVTGTAPEAPADWLLGQSEVSADPPSAPDGKSVPAN